jgi:hypothetical protein
MALGKQNSGRKLVVGRKRDSVFGLSQTSEEFSVTASGRIEMSVEEWDFKYQRKISRI